MTTPVSFERRFQHALQLLTSGAVEPAAAALAVLLEERPHLPTVRHALATALLAIGNADRAGAVAAHEALYGARPLFSALLAGFAAHGAIAARIALLEAAVRHDPRDYDATIALAADLHAAARPSAALAVAECAALLRPGERVPREIRAACLVDRGDVEAGLAAYTDLPGEGTAETAARHLVLMHYDPLQDNARLFTAHRAFAARHLRPDASPLPDRPRDAQQVLRVGWLSPRLDTGPVATFLCGLLESFDREQYRHVLIRLQSTTTRRVGRDSDEHVDAHGLDDAALLRRLRELRLDVLVDLAGHATANRIAVVAQRVAPLQVCWLDWFDTTAVPAMDAWLSDRWLTPEDSTQRYTEQLVRLLAGRFCYTPLPAAPVPEHAGGDAVVFASFNRLAKLNEGVVAAWSEILRRTPGARLHLRARHLGETATQAHLAARFAAHGVAPAHLQLGGELAHVDLLQCYRHVDVALDPFPFSGCATTCDALWMGCAVVTLEGETFVSRQSASLLRRLGDEDGIAHDRADYVERALALARRAHAARDGRSGRREHVRTALCDARAQADGFAAALRELWQEGCPRPT